MSALTDLFTAMANKIRSKTGTQTTYTPSEMVSDGIDDVYDAGVASATTPITPSNVYPASMTSGTGYKPTANGFAIESYADIYPQEGFSTFEKRKIYRNNSNQDEKVVPTLTMVYPSNSSPAFVADSDGMTAYNVLDDGYLIESYDSVTPSSTPESVSSGDIVKIGGSGVIVDAIPTPASITPSDSSPASLTANTPVTPSANGYAIASNPTSLTPSNSSPATITSGTIYKASAGGKAIESYSDIFPNDLTPARITYNNIYKATNDGYAIGSQPRDLLPDNSSPATITKHYVYIAGDHGYAIENYDPATPSDSNPAGLTNGNFYKMNGGGYAIASQPQSVTPSTSGAAFNSGIVNMSSGGYAYSQQPKLKIGTFTPSSSRFSVTGVGFKPKYLAIYTARTTETQMGCMYIYNEDFSTTKYMYASGDATGVLRDLGDTANYRLYSIDNDGFTINGYSTASWRGTGYYFALG